jgi:glycosyltransferase involved in cell wall biosynthesis
MTQEQYDKLSRENPNADLVRPFWNSDDYHKKIWEEKNITVLICQRKTLDATRLCLESLLKFYPDIPVLVVDGNSEDESTLYLHYKAALYPNVKVWDRIGLNSHGETMDEAIRQFITTKYVLLMDSDVISERHGYIEGMLKQFKQNSNLYATGNLMLVTRQNQACGAPYDESDVLKYAHPCCSIIDVDVYKTLQPFINHGAPCVNNMIDAEVHKLDVDYFPVDKYTSHLSGHSWTDPKTIWNNDHDVLFRPLVTFILNNILDVVDIHSQSNKDFDVLFPGRHSICNVVVHDGTPPVNINNYLFDIRFNVKGEYVCDLNSGNISDDLVKILSAEVATNPSDTITIDNITFVKRKVWQRNQALFNID